MQDGPDFRKELAYALDPVLFARERLRFNPDDWQGRVLASTHTRIILLCSRQAGKTSTVAVKALHTAKYKPGSLILMFSKSQRQSKEVLKKVASHLNKLGTERQYLVTDSTTELEFPNGSRMVSLPGSNPDNILGYSAPDLIIEDEASRVDDELHDAYRPMLATSKNGGQLILMSTPLGRRGHFHQIWTQGGPAWHRERVTAYEVNRITPAFLAEERAEKGRWLFAREYECAWADNVEGFFSEEDVARAFHRNPPILELAF